MYGPDYTNSSGSSPVSADLAVGRVTPAAFLLVVWPVRINGSKY